MLSRQLHLGADGCLGFAALCCLLLPFAWSLRDSLNPVPGIPWNNVTVWNIQKWPTATFCKKTTKASDRKQSDGRS
jgi:hypothetical protein